MNMSRYLLILLLSGTLIGVTGCKDALEQLTGSSQHESADAIYQEKLSTDLKAFDQIRTQQNSVFFELEDKLQKAAHKESSTPELRQELEDLSNTLSSQNDSFKTLHLQTTEVAKLRNIIMQLNYATIQIVQVKENPIAVNNRLKGYLNKQRNLINNYNRLRTEVEMKL